MQPCDKTEEIWEALKQTFGFDVRDCIIQGVCIPPPFGCGREGIEDDLGNELTRREYSISGLCRKCQEKVFGAEDEEELFDGDW